LGCVKLWLNLLFRIAPALQIAQSRWNCFSEKSKCFIKIRKPPSGSQIQDVREQIDDSQKSKFKYLKRSSHETRKYDTGILHEADVG
jgi:hypothetical protein